MLYGNGYDSDKATENCVVHLDTKSDPRVLFCGEDLIRMQVARWNPRHLRETPDSRAGRPQGRDSASHRQS